jgi:peptidoglycan/LPS O-acetylase OafA/YrhL
MSVPLHAVATGSASPGLLAVVGAATVGAAVLLGLAVAAFVRRRSRPSLLVAAAFAALLGRSAVVAFSALGVLSPTDHHVFEHGLDVVLVALVVAAVYYARTVSREVPAS